MDSYNFHLENILEWRSNIEKEVVEKFALIQRDLEEQKEILNRLIQEHQAAKDNRKYNNIFEIQQENMYVESLEGKVDSKLIEIDQIKTRLESARQEVLEAQKDRKVMERLKERDFKDHKNKLKHREQKELDEIGTLNHQQTTTG